jgi:hypothetical protein
VAEQFTGLDGQYVPIQETVRSFAEIINGDHDDIPERAFLLKGTIDQVVEEAKKSGGKKKDDDEDDSDSEENGDESEAKSDDDSDSSDSDSDSKSDDEDDE